MEIFASKVVDGGAGAVEAEDIGGEANVVGKGAEKLLVGELKWSFLLRNLWLKKLTMVRVESRLLR